MESTKEFFDSLITPEEGAVMARRAMAWYCLREMAYIRFSRSTPSTRQAFSAAVEQALNYGVDGLDIRQTISEASEEALHGR
ncbi:hypothetical protein [Nesterenkonia jeotgali]|uniref:Uncharacterized protein YerC n=1 Tax=Nesterenkonia jeotgali TaxID=317018 RepID=A0A839FLV0_9MICC|nr:hypothetical protein [Nesterenkonia jeotgali]MBA8920419.1 uncharacterized protein YerC [Nesterenkonia jeotgali]